MSFVQLWKSTGWSSLIPQWNSLSVKCSFFQRWWKPARQIRVKPSKCIHTYFPFLLLQKIKWKIYDWKHGRQLHIPNRNYSCHFKPTSVMCKFIWNMSWYKLATTATPWLFKFYKTNKQTKIGGFMLYIKVKIGRI